LFSGIILFGLLFRACVNPTPPVETPVPVAVLEIDTVPESDLYGIREDLYKVVEGKVRRNQTLADLLLPHGVSLQEIYHISLLPDSLIDERKIKPDMRYFFYTPDSLAEQTWRD